MNLSFNALSIIALLIIVQGILLGAVLWFRPVASRRLNRWLALFVWVFAGANVSDFAYQSKWLLTFPWLNGLTAPLFFVLPPFLYFYTRLQIQPDLHFRKRDWLHGLPALLLAGTQLPFYFLDATQQRQAVEAMYTSEDPYFADAGAVLLAVYTVIYLLAAILALTRHTGRLKHFFSALNPRSLRWLRNFLLGLTALWVLWALVLYYQSAKLYTAMEVLLMMYTYTVAYLHFLQPSGAAQVLTEPEDLPATPPKYEKSNLTPEQAAIYQQALIQLMENQKLFLEPEITLTQLASHLNAPAYHVSQVLNTVSGLTFYDFINHYRVEEAKRELTNPRKSHLTILSIGLDAGFNSKASFNAVFKKVTGQTPSEYRKNPSTETLKNQTASLKS
ncbi:helix-turn-helix transcriptional regulator [Larkinella soli]|uniref:helix-turn-helix transcriptional regulator n=1 Tax=Larkinella soli TaxID=1770527 RepID=UPI0013E3B156|nr:helix-turn-helix transcriptional regulator [Larkinella soli]